MIQISRYFENPLSARKYSRNELCTFAEDTLARLVANNPDDIFDTLISALDSTLSTMGATRGTRASATAIQESRTRATETLLRTIKESISRRSGRVIDQFGKKSAEYQAFYPQGLEAYYSMSYPEVEMRLDTLISASTQHLPALTAEFTGLKAQWVAVRGSQVTQKGTVSHAMDQEKALRAELEKTLMRTVLRVAMQFVGEEEKATIYFNQSLLEDDQKTPDEEPLPPTSPIA